MTINAYTGAHDRAESEISVGTKFQPRFGAMFRAG